VKQFLVALDQAANTLIYVSGDGWGWADETLSARLWRCYRQGLISDRWYRAVDRLFFWQTMHCFGSYLSESERKQLPRHYRQEVAA
jgi:hypothetical protein